MEVLKQPRLFIALIVVSCMSTSCAQQQSVADKYATAGLTAYEQEHFPEAEKEFSLALSEVEKSPSSGWRFMSSICRLPGGTSLTYCLYNLADVYAREGKYDKARQLYERAMVLSVKRLEGGWERDNLFTADFINHPGERYLEHGKYTEAEPLLKLALMLEEGILGEDHPHLIYAIDWLAATYFKLGKYEQAEALYKRALTIQEKEVSSDPRRIFRGMGLSGLAELYTAEGKYAEAEPLYQRLITIEEKTINRQNPLPPELEQLAGSLERYASFLRKTKRDGEATKLEARAETLLAQAKEWERHGPGRFRTGDGEKWN